MSGVAQPAVLRYLRRLGDDPDAPGVSDLDLLQRFVGGRDETAFELLLWRHATMVLSVCRGVLRDPHDAEDAFQTTFLALARKAGSIGRGQALGGWLYQVAFHAALKARQRSGREQDGLEGDVLPARDGPAVLDRDLVALLHQELNGLPVKYRTPLVLCYLEGKTHAEAARDLGWAKGTVSGRLARGRDLLRQRLLRRGAALSLAGLAALMTQTVSAAVPAELLTVTWRGAVTFAAGRATAGLVSAGVVQLTQEVLQAMFLSKLKTATSALLLAGCILVGAGMMGEWALAQKPGAPTSPPPVAKGENDPEASKKLRAQSQSNLKAIGVAFHNFNDTIRTFPSDVGPGRNDALLSWRVHLLPFLGQEALYKQFKLDEPWDSAHNLKLLAQMPKVYQTGTEGANPTSTYYQAFSGADTAFPPGRVLKLPENFPDGTSYTLGIVEAGQAVPWTKPIDLPFSSDKPLPKLGGPFQDVIHALFLDGAVHVLRPDFDEGVMRLAIFRNDGTAFDLAKLQAPGKPAKPANPKSDPEEDAQVQQRIDEGQRALAEQRRYDRLQAELELTKRYAAAATQKAEHAQDVAEKLKSENDRLRAAILDLTKQLGTLVQPAPKETRAEDVKALAEQLEKMQQQLKQMQESLDRLKRPANE